MPAKFRLLGPFELKQANGSPPMGSLKNLWSSPHGKVGEIPRSATGVYIFAIKMGSKHLPIYVGKSDHGFAPRLNNHKIYKKNCGSIPFARYLSVFDRKGHTANRQIYLEEKKRRGKGHSTQSE